MAQEPTNDVVFRPLTDSVSGGNCVVVLGAGVSAPDYPLWPKLIGRLGEACDLRPEDTASVDPSEVAEVAKNKNSDAYHATLNEIFGHGAYPSVKVARKYHLLARIKFRSYLNLNFDPYLGQILHLHRNITISDFPYLHVEDLNSAECFYLHGRLGAGRNAHDTELVLTATEFAAAYNPANPMLFSFLQQTFLRHDVCFLGCDPSERYFSGLLAACRSFCQGNFGTQVSGRPHWYLLWDDGSPDPEIQETGIKLVRYPRLGLDFLGFENILAYWAGERSVQIRSPVEHMNPFVENAEPPR